MTNRIISVKPLNGTILLVGFQNGIKKEYDVKNLFITFPQMAILEKDKALFEKVSVDVGGYGISWNDELDIEADEIWENGNEVIKESVDIMLQVGYLLTKAREEAHLTQKELAEQTGIDQANISKIERGIANPSLSTLKRLAHGTNTKIKIVFESQ